MIICIVQTKQKNYLQTPHLIKIAQRQHIEYYNIKNELFFVSNEFQKEVGTVDSDTRKNC